MNYDCENFILNLISLIFVFIGGCFAYYQWQKNTVLKRIEIVEGLRRNIRDDKIVSLIMDAIDWNDSFVYDSKFHIYNTEGRDELKKIKDDELFRMIDQTLSLFSYVCYLQKVHTITEKDLLFFEYAIKRLCDNIHICNYLYSLYHWSKSLGVNMSFSYLVDYCIYKGFLNGDFIKKEPNNSYCCYLKINKKENNKI